MSCACALLDFYRYRDAFIDSIFILFQRFPDTCCFELKHWFVSVNLYSTPIFSLSLSFWPVYVWTACNVSIALHLRGIRGLVVLPGLKLVSNPIYNEQDNSVGSCWLCGLFCIHNLRLSTVVWQQLQLLIYWRHTNTSQVSDINK